MALRILPAEAPHFVRNFLRDVTILGGGPVDFVRPDRCRFGRFRPAGSAWTEYDLGVASRDQYDDIAESTLTSLNAKDLAHIYRSTAQLIADRDRERRDHTLVVSALLELLGGRAVIPWHALENSAGYQRGVTESGDLVLQSAFFTEDGH